MRHREFQVHIPDPSTQLAPSLQSGFHVSPHELQSLHRFPLTLVRPTILPQLLAGIPHNLTQIAPDTICICTPTATAPTATPTTTATTPTAATTATTATIPIPVGA